MTADETGPGANESAAPDGSALHAEVLLVRHGEVAAVHQGTFYGCADVPLSEAGAAASERLAAELARDRPHQVWSSPLARARAVADPLAAAAGAALRLHADLRELDRGDWTHLAHDEVGADAVARYLADPEAGAAPGGERESEFAARVWATLDELAAGALGQRVVVVAHGHVIRVALRRLLGWDASESLRRFVPYHGVVSARLRPDGTGEVLSRPEGVLPEALRPRA